MKKFRGIAEAITEEYLEEAILAISVNKNDDDDVIEVFKYKIAYNSNGKPTAEILEWALFLFIYLVSNFLTEIFYITIGYVAALFFT